MDFIYIFKQLGTGFLTTMLIFSLTLVFSMPLGLAVYFGRSSKFAPFSFLIKNNKNAGGFAKALGGFKPVSSLFKFFISILRGTPLMLQLMVVFYGPYYIFGIRLSPQWRFAALIIGFVINYSAYFAEIYRGGIESISTGQYEAAEVLGYSKAKCFVKIILPQMIKRVIPPVTNEIITLVKDTSLGFVLSYIEMFTLAKELAAKYANITPLLIAGLFYFVFNFLVSKVMEKLEKKLSYYR